MGRVLFETDDPLNEANLGEFIAHQNNRDYIDDHPTVNANWSANELGLGSSRSWIFFDDRLYTVLPDSGTVTLPNSDGENFVFVTFDPETRDSPEYVAAESEGDVSDPKLLVFVADTSTETVESRNAAPDIDVATLEAVAASVASEPTEPTDVARKQETDALSEDLDDLDAAKADTPHDLGGADHSADTLSNLNSKVSDATLDDTDDPREPETHSDTHENGGTDEISVAGLSGELADPQPSKTQDDGVDVVASPTLNFGNGLDVTDDAGTATVDFDASNAGVESNEPDWVKDGNSPKTVSGQTSITYILDAEYDQLKVFIKQFHDDRVIGKIRVNGEDTEDYNIRRLDGSQDVGVDAVPVSNSFVDFTFSMRMEGFVPGTAGWTFGGLSNTNGDEGSLAQTATLSGNAVDTGAVTEIEYFLDGADPSDVNELTMEVFGRDVA